jgi:ABC-type uncharacterized transport system involved in gliding motility auxiliary subunit
MATQERKRTVAAQTGLYLLVVAAIVVVANLLSAGAYKRIDTTKAERYTLSQGSARMIQELKQPVEVEAYVKTGQANLDAFVRDLTDLLKEYERQGHGNFKYTVIEANTDELRTKAKEAGLQEQPFVDASATGEDQASITQGYMGLVFKYGSEKGVIPAMQPNRGEGLEFWITNKIREIRDKNDGVKHRIGIVTGKDELKLDDTNLVARQGQGGGPSLKQIITQNFPFYSVEEVDLKDGAEPIDSGFVGLIITQPRKDYTEKELRRIDEFLMQGNKALAVFASAVTMKPNDASMNAELSLHGLDGLLTGYGIQVNKDAVLDHGAQFRIGVPTQGGVVYIRHPGIAHVVNDPSYDEDKKLLDTSFPGFFRMDEMMVPFPSSIELLRDKQPADVKLAAVVRTTPNANVATGENVDMKLREQWEPKPSAFSQRIIGALAEGKLKSAFAGKPDEAIKAPEVAKEPSRVFVLASSQFLTNPFAYAGNGPEMGGQFQMFGAMGGDRDLQMISQPYTKYLTGTILSMKNTLDWLSGDTDLIAASAKLLGEPALTYSTLSKPTPKGEESEEEIRKMDETYRQSRKGLQQKVQWSLTLGVPVLFAAYGLFRWRSRENKRGLKAA